MKSLKRLFRRGPRARKNRPEPMQIQEYPPSSTAQPYADRTLPNSSSMNSHPPQVANIGPGVAPAGLVLDGYTQAGRHSLPPKTASDDQCSNGAAHSSKSDSTGTPPLLIDRLHDKSPNLKVCSDDHENTSRASFASDLSINYFGYLFGPDPSDGIVPMTFQKAWRDFEKTLSPLEIETFSDPKSPEQLLHNAIAIVQGYQEQSQFIKTVKRMKPAIEAFAKFSAIVLRVSKVAEGTVAGRAGASGEVWVMLSGILEATLQYPDCIKSFANALIEMGDNLEIVEDHCELLGADAKSLKKLYHLYLTIMQFCYVVNRLLIGRRKQGQYTNTTKIITCGLWDDLPEKINPIVHNFKEYLRQLHLCLNQAHQAMQSRDKIVDWLFGVPYHSRAIFETKFDICKDKKYEGTGDWFVEGILGREWKGRNRCDPICIHSPAGFGKSVLLTSMIQSMQEHEASRPDSALAYFFFDRSHQHSTVHQALRNICVQLMCHPHFKLSIPQPVKRLQERLKTKPQYSPTLTDLLGLVIDLASCFETTYIIIDALDERISTDYYNSDDILHVLKELCKDERRSNIHLLVSLREEDANLHKNLMTFMKNQPLEGHAHHEDLKAYVRGDIGRQRFLNGKALMPELKEMIVEKVSQKADGMFLCAALQVEELRRCISLVKLKEVLEVLPKGLVATFRQILQRMSEEEFELSHTVFNWIQYAGRPLTFAELTSAIGITSDTHSSTTIDRIEIPDTLVEICRALISIDRSSNLVTFRHKSIPDCLLRPDFTFRYEPMSNHHFSDITRDGYRYPLNHANGHSMLATTCVRYLLFPESQNALSFSPKDATDVPITLMGDCGDSTAGTTFQRDPFDDYATEHLTFHLHECKDNIDEDLLDLVSKLIRPASLQHVSWILRCYKNSPLEQWVIYLWMARNDRCESLYMMTLAGIPVNAVSKFSKEADSNLPQSFKRSDPLASPPRPSRIASAIVMSFLFSTFSAKQSQTFFLQLFSPSVFVCPVVFLCSIFEMTAAFSQARIGEAAGFSGQRPELAVQLFVGRLLVCIGGYLERLDQVVEIASGKRKECTGNIQTAVLERREDLVRLQARLRKVEHDSAACATLLGQMGKLFDIDGLCLDEYKEGLDEYEKATTLAKAIWFGDIKSILYFLSTPNFDRHTLIPNMSFIQHYRQGVKAPPRRLSLLAAAVQRQQWEIFADLVKAGVRFVDGEWENTIKRTTTHQVKGQLRRALKECGFTDWERFTRNGG